ncbi:MAG: hypothetical protein JSW12_10000 [Deltaproteobacteria bacterium]|nr:MAG: hypothetical protein JSW12_10000 [Deltaproteobacteria bacterium]
MGTSSLGLRDQEVLVGAYNGGTATHLALKYAQQQRAHRSPFPKAGAYVDKITTTTSCTGEPRRGPGEITRGGKNGKS